MWLLVRQAQIREKKPYLCLQVREGFCAPVREWEWSVENIKRKKKDKPEKKKKKGIECGVWDDASQNKMHSVTCQNQLGKGECPRAR